MTAVVRRAGVFRLHALDTVDSTNDEARRLAAGGAPHGTVVWARRQTVGRGRRGRPWVSEPGNLHCSILLRPACPATIAAQVGFVAANAVALAVAGLLPDGPPVTCKWPNDILVGGRKVAGILLESDVGRNGLLDTLVVGVGAVLLRRRHVARRAGGAGRSRRLIRVGLTGNIATS